ncbi:hypothetical protein [Winogradskyella sediminis]|uniref:Asparagine synthase n=1 Tax=Winogradskyella sediminis TaxID=1382466 RepID=A0A1H1S6B3_9FLAO|nr:hypothetical protein [Winogradskyella sediminis]SDS43318.1 hypothetical protein SAMN04489797_1590 [Winogradskyella sediminis]
MFTKEYKIGKYSIEIHMLNQPLISNDGQYFFGMPYGNVRNENILNDLNGWWVHINSSNEKLEITNDILGGFRLYYVVEGTNIYISDNYNLILPYLKSIEKHTIEYQFWLKHGFTTGCSTFINGLNKLSPASQLVVTEKGIVEESYFKGAERGSNTLAHTNAVYEDLCSTFETLVKSTDKKILLFSGGKDSCLLLQFMIKFKIDFTPVFYKLNPMSKLGNKDLIRVRRISQELNLELEEIEIDLEKDTDSILNEITKAQVFDKHFSLLHYIGNRNILRKYGKDTIIINGQSSDSILSFGPSENSVMSKFRRFIMYKPSHLMSRIGVLLMELKTKKKYRLPKNQKESLLALFDDTKYTRVIDKNKSEAYYKYLDTYIEKQTKHLKNYASKEMYVKILSFCQGSDNQIVVNSSKRFGLKTIMPFATPRIVYSTIKYKDENREIREPKYVINDILIDKFNFDYGEVLSQTNNEVVAPTDSKEKIEKYMDKVDYAYASSAISIFN